MATFSVASKIDENDVRFYNDALDTNQQRICENNSHEIDFISIHDFNNESHELATFCKEKKIFQLIQALAKLCVRINVPIASEERRSVIKSENGAYRYNDFNPKLGSGTILEIPENSIQSRVNVFTAKHLVFNSEEAKESTCIIYYDGSNSNHVAIKGTNDTLSDVNNDWCKFQCVIADEELETIREVLEEYKSQMLQLKRVKFKKRRKAILISHPHGCYKYISMGDQNYNKDGYIIYEAPACSGSSGAYVLLIGYQTKGYVHSGIGYSEGNIMGYSSGEIHQLA